MGFWLEVVTLVVPGFNDSDAELRQMAEFLAGISPDIPWHVTAFHTDYKMRTRRHAARDAAPRRRIGRAAGLRYVYAGNLSGLIGSLEDTHCPGCGGALVERRGFRVLRNRLSSAGAVPRLRLRHTGRLGSHERKAMNSRRSAAPGIRSAPPSCAVCWKTCSSESRRRAVPVPGRPRLRRAACRPGLFGSRGRGGVPLARAAEARARGAARVSASRAASMAWPRPMWRPSRRPSAKSPSTPPSAVSRSSPSARLRPLLRNPVAFPAMGGAPGAHDASLCGPHERGRRSAAPARWPRSGGPAWYSWPPRISPTTGPVSVSRRFRRTAPARPIARAGFRMHRSRRHARFRAFPGDARRKPRHVAAPPPSRYCSKRCGASTRTCTWPPWTTRLRASSPATSGTR